MTVLVVISYCLPRSLLSLSTSFVLFLSVGGKISWVSISFSQHDLCNIRLTEPCPTVLNAVRKPNTLMQRGRRERKDEREERDKNSVGCIT